jgi:hypothetical protein
MCLCIKAKKCIFFVRVRVFWPRRSRGLRTGEDIKRHFLAEVQIKFFRRPHELQSKRHTSLKKLQIYFVSPFFKYVVINNFFHTIFYQLANKTRNLLFAIQLHMYLHNLW